MTILVMFLVNETVERRRKMIRGPDTTCHRLSRHFKKLQRLMRTHRSKIRYSLIKLA
jgi:hypothetical protein